MWTVHFRTEQGETGSVPTNDPFDMMDLMLSLGDTILSVDVAL